MLPPAKALEQVLNNIVGFDLNPLAVISARTNYLLALGDLLEARKGEISIPIYLADSILTPSEGTDLFTRHGYSFTTAVGRFTIPRSLVQANYIDQLANLLEECVHVQLSPEHFHSRILQNFPLQEPHDNAEISLLDSLYLQLLKLEQQGINGIWAQIIKNAFAPLFKGEFDLIAGNPPWVNWESLPVTYREDTKPLWEYHGLFKYKGQLGKMREGKKDISTLMTCVVMENNLKENGRLGFVITQSVLKTTTANQGFRRFVLGNGIPISVIAVDDMVKLKPFEGASNRTAIMIIDKGRETRYPLRSYFNWYKPDGGTIIPENITLQELTQKKIATFRVFHAKPIDDSDITSAWFSARPQALIASKKLLGPAQYRAYEGCNTGGANAVYWVNIIGETASGILVSNVTESSKKNLDNVQAVLESDLLYPLLRSGELKRWIATPFCYIILVQDQNKQREGISEERLGMDYPKTYSFLLNFKEALESRPDRKYYPDGSPFYTMRNVGEYTRKPYKVVWGRVGSRIDACVISAISEKSIIPQETISFVPLENNLEAHYVCSVVNSTPFNFIVQSYSQKGGKSFGTPSILENVRVPRYEINNEVHQKLSAFSQQAHAAAIAGDAAQVQVIEGEINLLAAQLWGLTDEELKEIQESLEELS